MLSNAVGKGIINMVKRQIFYNLRDNSLQAYYSAIELHNKPNFKYRYETVVILLINAWELLLKAFIRKHISKNIFYKDGRTYSINDCLVKLSNYLEQNKMDIKYKAYIENIKLLCEYRDNATHFYNDESVLPVLFTLIAKGCIDYNDFYKSFFGKIPLETENLHIMPIGFKLPFNPKDYLNKEYINLVNSEASKVFIEKVVKSINELESHGVSESIVIGFDIYMLSVKKVNNADFKVVINQDSERYINISKQYNITNDPNAHKVIIDDESWLKIYKYPYAKLCEKLKKNVKEFKKGKVFNKLMKNEVKTNPTYASARKISATRYGPFGYTDAAYKFIRNYYTQNIQEKKQS